MFIFRSIAYLLAILGYILGGITLYLGFNPIEYPAQQKLETSDLLNCQTSNKTYTPAQLDQTEINKLKTELGEALPVELVKDLANTIESVSNSIGATTEISIDSCDTNQKSTDVINEINSKLNVRKSFYEYGTLEQFVNNFNQLPYAKLTNIQINVASTFARSNICNKAINKTDLYLFTALDSNLSDNSKVILFNIRVKPKTDTSIYEKIMSNIIISGHYFKARFTCNG